MLKWNIKFIGRFHGYLLKRFSFMANAICFGFISFEYHSDLPFKGLIHAV